MSETISLIERNIALLQAQFGGIEHYDESDGVRTAIVPETSTGPVQTYFSLTNLMDVRFSNVTCEPTANSKEYAMSWPSNVTDIQYTY